METTNSLLRRKVLQKIAQNKHNDPLKRANRAPIQSRIGPGKRRNEANLVACLGQSVWYYQSEYLACEAHRAQLYME